ncbi:MAG: nucleoside diphosphate kinase regulator [Aureliella sp.]
MARKKLGKKKIIVTVDDHRRLTALLSSHVTQALADKPYLDDLRRELEVAEVVEPDCVPADVVTMNSTVQLRELGEEDVEIYTLVYPRDANIAQGKLSILAPIGTAILGYRAGDVVPWRVPHGSVQIVIDEVVSQPEREGMLS